MIKIQLKYDLEKISIRERFFNKQMKFSQKKKSILPHWYILPKFHKYIDIIKINNSKPLKKNDLKYVKTLSSCYSAKIPEIDLKLYIDYVIENITADFSDINGLLIHSIIIIDRILKRNFTLNEYNIHRIVGYSLLLSLELYNDNQKYSKYYLSLISGIQKKEIILMEQEILEYIDYDVFITKQQVLHVMRSIINL